MIQRLFIILVFIIAGCGPRAEENFYVVVEQVIDGDTVKLTNGEKVRYIGIDTPEFHHPYLPVQYMAKDAKEFNKSLVNGRRVRLEFDAERRDKYGRLLAYVYVGDRFVNAELLKEGYARTLSIFPNVKHEEEFLKLQSAAQEERRGLWAQ